MRFGSLTLALLVIVGNFFVSAYAAEPREYVQDISDRVLKVIENSSYTEKMKVEKLESIFKDVVAIDWMARFSLGRYYRQASDEQKKRYNELYKRYLVASYIPRFREYTGESIKIVESKDAGDGDFVVYTTLVSNPEDPEIKVDYRLREFKNSPAKLQVIDVIGEGVSLITTQRSDFGGMISRKGLDFFIDALEKRVNKLESESGLL